MKAVFAFVIIVMCLLSVVVMALTGTIPAEVAVPIITAALGAAVGYLFPSPLNQN